MSGGEGHQAGSHLIMTDREDKSARTTEIQSEMLPTVYTVHVCTWLGSQIYIPLHEHQRRLLAVSPDVFYQQPLPVVIL